MNKKLETVLIIINIILWLGCLILAACFTGHTIPTKMISFGAPEWISWLVGVCLTILVGVYYPNLPHIPPPLNEGDDDDGGGESPPKVPDDIHGITKKEFEEMFGK